MADIRCPNCGKNNPDFLDVCQFCQTPLTPEAMVHTGESPTKKNTGELEPILPDWLRDVRRQGRDSAGENAVQSVTQPKVQKSDAPDLLAGLASQSDDDDDDVPDWLASINPAAKLKPSELTSSEPSNDFFAQFNKTESVPATPKPKIDEPLVQEETLGWLSGPAQPQAPVEKDELSAWLSSASETPAEPFAFQPDSAGDNSDWMSNLAPSESAVKEIPVPEEKEDLGWLHTLEASAKQSEDHPAPKQDAGWDFGAASIPSRPSGSQEDLSWLNNLGGASEPAQPSAPPSSQEDLSWLNNLGGISEPAQPSAPPSSQEDLSWLDNFGGTPQPAQPPAPASSQDDLSWLNNLGETPQPAQPSAPVSSQEDLNWLNNLGGTPESVQPSAPASSQEDLSWLGNLGGTPEPAQASVPASTQGDLDWLANLGAASEPSAPASAKPFGTTDELSLPKNLEEEQGIPHISPFTPRRTAPLSEEAANDTMPDWLRSASEETPILPLGASALDHLRDTAPKTSHPSTPAPASVSSDLFPASSESRSLSNQDVDSLFSVDMPDWLSQSQPGAGDATSQAGGIPSRDESLAPVELPSWVQAMRPVESVLSETGTPGTESQPTEKEGPLAGLRGVIPFVPIGSSRRPKAFSLKLQATDEQQASAALLDQILAGESVARAVAPSSLFMPQRVLRWVISGLLFIVLGAVIFTRSQVMQVSAVLTPDMSAVSNAVASIPDGSSVLIVIDYEPSLAGEMEAVSGPLLDQLVLARAPRLFFLSTSPNSSALVERLLASANISKPIPDGGLGYLAGEDYSNLGYLPGGSAGVLGFVSQPNRVLPSAAVQSISEYAAIIVITDHAESGRTWVEQLDVARQVDPTLATRSLLLVTSAQAGPLLQPYVSSKQVNGMINGLANAARYEFVNNSRPGTARLYWDAFGIGILMAVILTLFGSVWGLITGIRARRADSEEG